MPGEDDRLGHDTHQQQARGSHARTRLIRFNKAIDCDLENDVGSLRE